MAETTSHLEGILQRFRDELARAGIGVERLLLFGSHARSEAQAGSDIDLIVVSADWERFSFLERLEILGVAAARILEPIQAQGFTPREIELHETGTFWEAILESQTVPV